MKHATKRLIRILSPSLYETIRRWRFLHRLGTRDDSYLITSGFLKSRELGYPCRLDSTPLPWMNYTLIAFLEERLNRDMDIFEYGSGYSTLFYSQLVKHVVSVEYDKEWYERIIKMAGTNVQIIYQAMEYDGEYCTLINQQNRKFDVVVVDGRDRVRCAINSCRSLSENGVVILDDSMREEYSDGIKFLLDNGFRKIDFMGLKPASKELGPAQTSIFYRPGNCLGI